MNWNKKPLHEFEKDLVSMYIYTMKGERGIPVSV